MTDREVDDPVNVIDRVTAVHFVVESCVRCGETHRHGAAADLDVGDLTHRVAHCDDGGAGYYLKRTEETEVEA